MVVDTDILIDYLRGYPDAVSYFLDAEAHADTGYGDGGFRKNGDLDLYYVACKGTETAALT